MYYQKIINKLELNGVKKMNEDEIKISELTSAQQLNDEDIVMIVQNGMNKKVTVKTLINMLSNNSTKKAHFDITEDIEAGSIITIPISYKVGTDCLDAFLNGEYLRRCTSYDNADTGMYSEVGEAEQESFYFYNYLLL